MLKISKYLPVIFFILLPIQILFSKGNPGYKIQHLSIEDGLSQNTVRSILQDSKGFLWFATEDGLNRFDGYKFKVFRHNLLDSSSLSDNFIWIVYEDKKGDLWIGTNNGGLNKFDREKERFIRYQNNPGNLFSLGNNNIRAICEDNKGVLWIGTEGGGLNSFDVARNKFSRVLYNASQSSGLNNVLALLFDGKNELWLGTDNGLYSYNTKSGEIRNYLIKPNAFNNANNIINSLYIDDSGILWTGTDGGLFQFDLERKIFTKFTRKESGADRIISNVINFISENKSGDLLIGSGNGLGILEKGSNSFVSLLHNSSEVNSLSNNHITSVIADNTGIIWVGTTEAGINKIDRKPNKFSHYNHDPFDDNSLSYSTVRSIFQESDGILWIGTLEGGLNKFDRKNNKFQHYKNIPNDPASLSENTITSITRTKKGDLWIGTWGGGLERAEFDNTGNIAGFKHFKNNSSDARSISSNIIQAVYEDVSGRLWIGTQSGLDLYNKKSNSFVHFNYSATDPNGISDNRIQSNCIYEDKKGNLWIGTWNGLNKVILPQDNNFETNRSIKFQQYFYEFNNPNSLSNSRILSIYEDKNNVLWVGTYGGGLNKIIFGKNGKSQKLNFKRYTEKDGLANDIIYGILGDDENNLWMSTNNGLSKFNPSTETFQNYYQGEGLQSNQFYWGACFKGMNGELFFGGINGFNSFFPSELKFNTHIPPVYITDFQIFNKSVTVSEKNSPLKSSIEFTKNIVLSYDKNVLTFEFVALDYFNSHENKYSYKMENFDKDWVFAGRRNIATYTNLDPGEYVFKVIGSNNDDIWNKSGISIKLIVKPPFWRTWWFILIAFIVVGGTIFSFIQMHIRDLLAVERVRVKLAADLHDNIGSSLTEISILSEIISKKLDNADKEISKNLKMISNTSRELIDKMSDIVWLVNPKRDSLYDLILRLEDKYSEILSCTNISFRSQNLHSLEKVSLSMEHRQNLYLIFKEGINNCVTHSGCTEILLNANLKGKILEMTLTDNGIGFSKISKHSGNGLDNMKSRAEKIGGKLTVTSSSSEGTCIKFIGLIS